MYPLLGLKAQSGQQTLHFLPRNVQTIWEMQPYTDSIIRAETTVNMIPLVVLSYQDCMQCHALQLRTLLKKVEKKYSTPPYILFLAKDSLEVYSVAKRYFSTSKVIVSLSSSIMEEFNNTSAEQIGLLVGYSRENGVSYIVNDFIHTWGEVEPKIDSLNATSITKIQLERKPLTDVRSARGHILHKGEVFAYSQASQKLIVYSPETGAILREQDFTLPLLEELRKNDLMTEDSVSLVEAVSIPSISVNNIALLRDTLLVTVEYRIPKKENDSVVSINFVKTLHRYTLQLQFVDNTLLPNLLDVSFVNLDSSIFCYLRTLIERPEDTYNRYTYAEIQTIADITKEKEIVCSNAPDSLRENFRKYFPFVRFNSLNIVKTENSILIFNPPNFQILEYNTTTKTWIEKKNTALLERTFNHIAETKKTDAYDTWTYWSTDFDVAPAAPKGFIRWFARFRGLGTIPKTPLIAQHYDSNGNLLGTRIVSLEQATPQRVTTISIQGDRLTIFVPWVEETPPALYSLYLGI